MFHTMLLMQRMLAPPLPLHDVRDVEALCRAVLRRADLRLPHHEEEDALAYLISAAWELSERWDPTKDRAREKGREPSFAASAERDRRRRLVDFQRSRYRTRWVPKGYVYERQRPDLVSLNDEGRGGVDEALAARSGDRPADRDSDLPRLYAGGGGSRARERDYAELGLEPPCRAA